MKECTIALLCNVTLFPKTLPYFYAIKFLKLNKIEKVFDIKSQIIQLKLNHKPPTGAWACLSFSKKSGKLSLIQQEILKAHNCMSISIVKIP